MKQNYGYKYALGRFHLWAISNFKIFVALAILSYVAGICAIFFTDWHIPLLFSILIPLGLWGVFMGWGEKYKILLPEYWIEERRKYLKKYPELVLILHEGDSITDEEIEQMKNLRDNYVRLKELFESKLEEEKQLAERAKELGEEIEEVSEKLSKEEKALGSHHG
jgi:ABC-type multidrug transport system fused ATPase/permease subunit